MLSACATAGEGLDPGATGAAFDASVADATPHYDGGRDAGNTSPRPPAFEAGLASDDADTPPVADDAAPPPAAEDASADAPRTAPDAAPTCTVAPASICGLAPQCGCAGATPTCDVTNATTGAAQCVAAGATPVRDACKTTQDCAPGLTCWGGACRAYCAADGAACAGPGDPTTCIQQKNGSGKIEPNMLVCRFACALDDPSACGGTNANGVAGCIVYTDDGTDCRAMGTRTDGESCSGPADCAPGYACAPAFEGNACTPWCRVQNDRCDPRLYLGCRGFSPKLTIGGVEYGYCN